MVCKNCHHEFSGKFCNMCGQAADTHEINLKFLWKELRSTFIKFDEGYIFTIKELFTRPGHFINEYIEGKRILRTKPVSFVLIAAGIYSFIYLYFDIKLAPDSSDTADSSISSDKFNHWFYNNFALAELILIPLFTIGSSISFIKYSFNFFEHLILNCYVFGQRILVNLLMFPFLIAYNGTSQINTITYITLVINIALVFWTYSQFFEMTSKIKTFALTLLTYSIVIIEIVCIIYIYIYAFA